MRSGSGSETATTKKKFGKNLNKLVKPAAPPIVDRSSGSSRNGLLLLSTKKTSSLTTPNAGAGLLSNKGAALSSSTTATAATTTASSANSSTNVNVVTSSSSSGIITHSTTSSTYESKPASTHDVLLSAVVGAAQAEAHLPPDAWGVAASNNTAAQQPSLDDNHETDGRPEESPRGGVAEARTAADRNEGRDASSSGQFDDAPEHPFHQLQQQHPFNQHPYLQNQHPPEVVIQTSNWDEYGGRGDSTSTSHRKVLVDVGSGSGSGGGTDNSSIGRGSNSNSSAKNADNNNNNNVDKQGAIMSRLARERAEKRRSEEDARMVEQKERATQRLRELDEKRGSTSTPEQQHEEHLAETPPRRAWNMTRSGSRELWEPDQKEDNLRRARDNAPPAVATPQSPTHGDSAAASAAASASGPIIHLSSYDDRDRGESRNSNAAPRMLYDPKSGAMVAVKSRDETGGAANSRANKKAAVKKGGRTDKKDRGDVNNNKSDSSSVARDSSPDARNSRKQRRSEDAKISSANGTGAGSDTAASSSAASGVKLLQPANPDRRLPRTCGVLYTRDEKGIVHCADDCDGDLGYGAHSVPGGRTKNPKAYALYIKEKQQQHLFNNNKDENNSFDGSFYDDPNYSIDNVDGGDIALFTGFNPEEELPEEQPEPVEYVTADDKLELVTGEDSPTLKPTAKEWAPSRAALAAAAAAAAEQQGKAADRSVDTMSEDNDEYEEEDDDDDGPLGLGFDPTQDMDFVMQSPSGDGPEDTVESVAISALSLEPPVFNSSTVDSSGPRHIFAFGSSGTWGVTQTTAEASSSDWKIPSVSETGGLFDAGVFRGTKDDTSMESAASFLNIPSSNSWGSPSLGLSTSGAGSKTTTTGD